MSNPWSDIYKNLREPYLQEKMAKKDYDGDGKIESGKDEYMGSRDKAIKKAMGKKVEEHHQKDADGKVIEHGDTEVQTEDILKKDNLGRMKLTAADVRLNSGAYRKSLKDVTNKVYSPVIDKAHYEPAKVNKPNYSNWREDFVWDDNVDEAAKGKKLDVKEGGVKNKIEINPDDGLKESEKKKLIDFNVKGVKKDYRDMSRPAGTAQIDYRKLYMGDNINELKGGKPGDGYLGPTMGKLGIPNPIRMAKDAVDSYNRANQKKVNTVNKISPGSASMPKFKQFNKDTSAAYKNLFQSHEPQGDMVEAKYEKGASTYGKASIRNKRMFGKGGNAAPPEERGAAISVRRDRHAARRGIKKGNKYHEPGKYRPEVDGVNKPEQERKGKNMA